MPQPTLATGFHYQRIVNSGILRALAMVIGRGDLGDDAMTVGSVLKGKGGDVATLAADALVGDNVTLFTVRRIGAAPVIDDRRVVGVFSKRDVIHGLKASGTEVLTRRVCDLMTKPAVTVTQEVSVIGALGLMTERRIRHLPVVEHDTLIGLVSIGGLALQLHI